MSIPNNVFTSIFDLGQTIGPEEFFEQRIENNGDGNPVYCAWSPNPNAGTDLAIWYIKKFYYDDNQSCVRVQLPDDGIGYKYIWDNRATYFS